MTREQLSLRASVLDALEGGGTDEEIAERVARSTGATVEIHDGMLSVTRDVVTITVVLDGKYGEYAAGSGSDDEDPDEDDPVGDDDVWAEAWEEDVDADRG